MHICMVMAGDEEGGLEKHVVELANALVRSGQQVTLIAHQKYAERVHGVIFKALDLSKSRKNPILLWKLYKTIQATQADLVHVQASKAAAMVAPLLRWLKQPSVATVHGLKKNTRAFTQFNRIIAVSQNVARLFSDDSKVRIVFNGVKQPEFDVTSRKVQQPLQAIAIGRLVSVKGFDLLIDAWKDVDAQLWIVGDGSEKEALQQQIDGLGLAQKIRLLGQRDDINQLLQQADFLVISSRKEGGPYTLAEALLMHCPVISTDVGMVSQILPDTMICPVEDTRALQQLIQQSVNNYSTLQQHSQALYTLAQQQLTLEAMTANTLEVYREIAND